MSESQLTDNTAAALVTAATALVVLSHGSRHPEADASVENLAAAISKSEQWQEAAQPPAGYAAHLDFSEDTLAAVACRAARHGHQRLVVVPLLFTTAFHMREDVPAAIAEARKASGIDVIQAEQIGLGSDLLELLAGRAREKNSEDMNISKLALFSVGSTTPGANEAVADFARDLAAKISTGLEARAFVATGPASREGNGPGDLLDWADQPTLVIPLFASPGTLLDGLAECAAVARNIHLLPPLGEELAPVVVQRYRKAV